MSTATDPIEDAIQQAMAERDDDEAEEPEGAEEEPEPEATEEGVEEPEADDEDDQSEEPGDGDEAGDETTEDDDEAEEDSGEGDSEAVEIPEEGTVRLPDGTEVSGQELRDGYLRQKDYTKKTQQAAKERREVQDLYNRMKSWYEERSSDPARWVGEIVTQYTDSPAATLSQAVAQTEDPTGTVAWAIRDLAEQGKLDDQFVQTFGLEEVANTAQHHESNDRVRQLEQRLERQERERQQTEQQRQIVTQYEQQWQRIKDSEGLQFESADEEANAKLATLKYAKENEIPDLEAAYAAKAYREGRQTSGGKQKSKGSSEKAKQAVQKKQQAKAMQRKAPAAQPKPRESGDIEGALRETASELGMDL